MNRWIIAFFIFFNPIFTIAQDPGFSQFFANPLYLNPAFAGTSELPRVVLNYRNQWPQKGATFTTYSVSFDQQTKNLNSGFGFQLYHDRELNNVVNSSSGLIIYSYHVKLGNQSFMTLGVQGGMVLKQFNTSSLIFPSEINQLSGEITGGNTAYSGEKKGYPDFAVGALGQHSDFYWGASVHHLSRPDESIIEGDQKGKLPLKVTVHGGANSRKFHYGLLSRRFTISPNILYQQQGTFKQINLGFYMIEKSFLFGGWFRNNWDIRPDALIFLAGMAKNKFRFGYSFDLTLSKLSNYSYGSHELSLTFFLGTPNEFPIRDKLIIPAL